MTEEEWIACTDPRVMLRGLAGRISDRKLRLFASACCRTVWHLLHKRGRKAISVTEEFMDGMTNMEAWERAREGLRDTTYWLAIPRKAAGASRQAAYCAASAVGDAVSPNEIEVRRCCEQVLTARLVENEEQVPERIAAELAELLRDVVGTPFRPFPDMAVWLQWRKGLVTTMARDMYDGRDFADMPILADALEEAGCADPLILGHLRGPGPHVRGCWALDLILGKS